MKPDDASFEQVLAPWRGKLESYLLRTLENRQDAEDTAGEVIMRALSRFADFRGESGFGTWLFAICRNVLKEKFRRDRRARYLLERLEREKSLAPFELSPEELLLNGRNARRRAVIGALGEISEHQRRLVMLILFSGYSMDEAADELGLKAPAVRKLASRAVRSLREILIKRGEIDA
jgi:RNA polymerase sigma-70 factor (ECF subfamily)